MIIGGQCPVQGDDIVDGWLFYFRARGSWDLYGWAPGRWSGKNSAEGLESLDWGSFSNPEILIGEQDEDETFPQPGIDENEYPGWWSHEYAELVAAWAMERAEKKRTEAS